MRCYGPFKVLSCQGASAYKIAILFEWKKRGVHNVFNHAILSPYIAPFFPSQMVPLPPPPELVGDDSHPEYKVESILDSRKRRGRLQYRVHWKGYPSSDDTWEPKSHLDNSPELLTEFHRRYPTKPS